MRFPSLRSCARCAAPLGLLICANSDATMVYYIDAYPTIVEEAAASIAAQGNEALEWIRVDWRLARPASPAYTPDNSQL